MCKGGLEADGETLHNAINFKLVVMMTGITPIFIAVIPKEDGGILLEGVAIKLCESGLEVRPELVINREVRFDKVVKFAIVGLYESARVLYEDRIR